MSRDLQFRCDRCNRQEIVTDQDPPWVGLKLESRGFIVPDIHVCPGCLSALADFLPGVPRETIAAFAQHDRAIDISVAAGHAAPARIVGVGTVSEEMTTTFHPRRIEIENASQWIIEEFAIESTSQLGGPLRRGGLAPRTDIPGEDFVKMLPEMTGIGTAFPGAVIIFRVRYVGGNPEGGVWRAKLHGRAVGFPEGDTAA
jgi:hypothetical protein